MATVGVNKLLPVAVGVIFLALVIVVFKSATKSESNVTNYSGDLASAPEPDAIDIDSPADTIRSLQGQIQLLQEDNDQTKIANDSLVQKNSELVRDRELITQELTKTVENKLAAQEENRGTADTAILTQIEEIKNGIDNFKASIDRRVSSVEAPQVPVGLGLDLNTYQSGQVLNATEVTDVVWIQPLDVPLSVENTKGTRGSTGSSGILQASNTVAGNVNRGIRQTSNNRQPTNTESQLTRNEPNSVLTNNSSRIGLLGNSRRTSSVQVANENTGAYFTLPDLSVLSNSTTLTALIGKVYLEERVTNPYPFKVVVGRDNITANNQELPSEIQSMIFEGFATGDWPLSCVRGTLTAATFVFEDGSVKSAYVGDPGARPNTGPFDPNALGYISDQWGNPCVNGEPITNAPRFLAQRLLLAGAEGYATALKAQNIDTVVSTDPTGNQQVTETLTGSAKDAGIASAYLGGIQETSDWLRDRQRQSFDAIYIRSGQTVSINLQQELRLDIDAYARKVDYSKGARRHATLD